MKTMTTLGEVSERVDAMNQDCLDQLTMCRHILLSLKTMKIGNECHTIRTVAQRSIAWETGHPLKTICEMPSGASS